MRVMGILAARPPMCGNAIQLTLGADIGAAGPWRVLRRLDPNFIGGIDPNAVIVADHFALSGLMDTGGLVNGTPVYYQAYLIEGATYVADGGIFEAVPNATFGDLASDPLTVVRDRLRLAMAVEMARGTFKLPPQAGGVFPVTTAPYGLSDNMFFPLVSVHLDQDAPGERGIGEQIIPPTLQSDGQWLESEGWLSQVSIRVVGVSLNSDERITLRTALKRAIIANLAIFNAAGFINLAFAQSDDENFDGNNAPLFMTTGSLTFLAPSLIGNVNAPVTDIIVSATAENVELSYGPDSFR